MHVEVAVVSVFCHLLAVHGIAVLRVYLLGSNFLKTVEVTFSAIAIATFILKLVAHLGGSVLGIATRGLHGCHHPTATGHVIAWFCLLVFYGNMSAERQGNAFEQVGTSR